MNKLSGQLFTVDSLKEILGNVLKAPQKEMGPKKLLILVQALNNIRKNLDDYKFAQTLAAIQHERFIEFIDNLRAFVHNQSKYELLSLNDFEKEIHKKSRIALDAFNELAQYFVKNGILVVNGSDIVFSKRKNWHNIAATIATHFTYAMVGQKLGTSNEGPVARFVHAVIPMITGETPTLGAVAKRLKDMVKRTKAQTGTISRS